MSCSISGQRWNSSGFRLNAFVGCNFVDRFSLNDIHSFTLVKPKMKVHIHAIMINTKHLEDHKNQFFLSIKLSRSFALMDLDDTAIRLS